MRRSATSSLHDPAPKFHSSRDLQSCRRLPRVDVHVLLLLLLSLKLVCESPRTLDKLPERNAQAACQKIPGQIKLVDENIDESRGLMLGKF